ncbi:putative NodU family carbamoyl transferase [Streptomyces calvus]
MRILGINALFHDPAAALVVDGRTVAAAEEERFSRRKRGKRPLPFFARELPERSARRCLEQAGLRPADLDAVTHSFDPDLTRSARDTGLEYARRARGFLAEALPALDPARVVFVAPKVLTGRAAGLFSRGPLPSPYMLFVHDVAHEWRDRIPAVVHVDGTARIQTVEDGREPLVARMPRGVERRTGLPVVDTGLNTAGRPMADDPRDALERFGSAPVDLPAIGPYAVRRGRALG